MPNNKWVWIVCSVFLATLVLSAVAGAVAPKPDYLWWKFDEGSGTVAKDSSGNGRDGTITGATWVTPGAGNIGACLDFNSNGTVINAVAGTGLNGKSEITIAMWIKSRVTNTDKGFFEADAAASGADNFDIRYDAAGSTYGGTNVMKMGVTSTSGTQQLEASNGIQTTGWQHVCLTWKGGVGLKFYSNGKPDKPTGVDAVNTGTISGCTTLIVGQGCKDSGGGWNGYIDDVRIYTYALADAQVADLLSFTSADTASAPSPATAATDVPRDVTLSWTAAASAQKNTVYLGTTFADVNNATVAKPGNVVVSAAQTATTYAPASPLQYGVTYYWRVDETSATGTVTKGDVWSFTAEPYAYPLTPTAATASSSQPGMGPENTINGSGLDASGLLHGTDGTTMWLSQGTQPNWIQYQFDKVYKLSDMKVWNSNQMIEAFIGFGAKDVKVEYSTDGTTWTAVANVPQFAKAPGAPGYAANTTVNLGGVMAKYVKLTITSSWGGLPTTGLSEVRFSYVPVQARVPQPATAATDVSLDATLSWRPGREAASHKVFFGTDQQAVTNGTVAAKTVTDPSFSPSGLLFGTTYYWRVDEVNTTTYPGDVWSFTTAPYGVVDDFESYNDDTNRIYDSWIDGLTDGKSGSTVGYLAAPFAEQTIVHGGKQSMPLAYDDSKSPFYSEATRTFTPAVDWTAHGVKRLALYFQGIAKNTGQLYLKINSTKVAYNGASGDIAKTTWTLWNVDLTTLTGLSKVTSLTIGVEGSGVKGTLYIDDIRLYATPASSVQAAIITGVTRANGQAGTRTDASPLLTFTGSTAPVPMPDGGLKDGAFCYSDRPYPWALTPAQFVGAEYVLTFNQDKTAGETDVTYTVTFSRACTIFLTCDDRITDQQGSVDHVVAAFAKAGQFKNTGQKLYVQENATTNRPVSVFSADLPAGTYVFGSQDSGYDFYTIGAMSK